MSLRTRMLFVLGAGVLAAASAGSDSGLGPAPVQAALGLRSHVERFGMHGLGPGQGARLTINNPRPLSEREIVPCIRVTLVQDVYEDDAGRLRFVRRVEREEKELDPGEAVSLELTAGRTGDYVSAAVYVRALERGPVQAVSTLEVREDGRTLFVLPGVRKGFDPQPDPPAESR